MGLIALYLIMTPLLQEDFETGNIPADWTIGNGGNPSYTWYVSAYGDTTRWPLEPPQSGNYYAVCDSREPGSPTIFEDTLISPGVLVPQSPTVLYLKFGLSYLEDSASTSSIGYVILSTFSAGSWAPYQIIRSYGDTDTNFFYMEYDSLDLLPYAGSAESLKIGFYYSAQDTEFWYAVDDILIEGEGIIPGDVELMDIINPRGYFPPLTPTDVQVLVRNNSSGVLTFPVTVTITDTFTGSQLYNQTINLTLPGQTQDTAFFPQFTGDSNKVYEVVAFTSYSGDPNPLNDTLATYAYTSFSFGTIIRIIPITGDSSYLDLTYNSGNDNIYVVHPADSVITINATTESRGPSYLLADFSQGGTEDVPWGILYDENSNTFWTTQLGFSIGSPDWCYAVNYNTSFDTLGYFDLLPASLIVYGWSDAPGANYGYGLVNRGAYMAIYYLDLNNQSFPIQDSITFNNPLLNPVAIGAIGRYFVVAGFGNNKVYLVDNTGALLDQTTLSDFPWGITAYRYSNPEPQAPATVFINVGGYEIVEMAIGRTWQEVGVSEKGQRNRAGENITLKWISPTSFKLNTGAKLTIFDVSGRLKPVAKIGKNVFSLKGLPKGIYFIQVKEKTFKVLLLKE